MQFFAFHLFSKDMKELVTLSPLSLTPYPLMRKWAKQVGLYDEGHLSKIQTAQNERHLFQWHFVKFYSNKFGLTLRLSIKLIVLLMH